ncbi:hypothetical protein NQ318_007553 [Aromia moschata]|uniref:DUF4817 domain-containing protein n=1 Tax=Aromia moschata TaxID=1265417 RepID=A0AAV8YEZ9_9CUCU|nr:hypothetical protein NQ318_007553 [Aromia moschata]
MQDFMRFSDSNVGYRILISDLSEFTKPKMNYLTDMLQVYFECNKSSRQAVQLYRERFPNREIPQHQKFARLETNLRAYGAFKKPPKTIRQFQEEVELNVFFTVQQNPRTSTREIASNIGSSKRTV